MQVACAPCQTIWDYFQWKRPLAATHAGFPDNGSGIETFESTTRPSPEFNECKHLKKFGYNYPYLWIIEGSTSSYFYNGWYWRKQMAGSRNTAANFSPLPWYTCDGAQRRAWWEMQPRYESEIQFLNFLYELKDFKRMAKSLMSFEFSKIGSKMRDLRRRLVKLSNETKLLVQAGGTLRDITKTAAEAQLVNSFAIKPLISDVAAILHTLALTVETAQSQFAARGAINQMSHYTETINESKTGSYGTANSAMYFTGTRDVTTFTACMQYRYKYKMRHGWELIKRGMGLEFNAEVLWNAIPWSFLVDYFYKVGHAIHTMSTDPNVTLSMSQYSESMLTRRDSGIMWDKTVPKGLYIYAPYSNGVGGMVPLAGYAGSHYERRVTMPNKGVALPKFAHLSTGQKWNMAALIRAFF